MDETEKIVKIADQTNSGIQASVTTVGAGIGAVNTVIRDAAGEIVSSFGGGVGGGSGTQYADGAARGTSIGTLAMVDDGTNMQSLSGDTTGKLNVNSISGTISLPTDAATSVKQSDGSQKTKIVDGSGNVIGSTANAIDVNIKSGSSMALETGGNLEVIKTNTDKIPALGQALAAASTPVVLTAAQMTTLTPLATIPVTNIGTFAIQENGDALTSLQLIGNAVHTDDTSTHSTGTSKGVGIMATATPTDTSVNANDIGMVAMTTDRRLLVNVDWNGTQPVTGSGTSAGALRVELPTNGTGVVGLAAGTNGIGKLTANSGVDIGDVDILTLPGTGVEDAAQTAGGILLMAGSVRRDTAASSSGTAGDNSTLNTDALGKLWVTATYAEDTAHVAADTLGAVGVRRIDTAASSAGTTGDYATLDQSAEGALWTTLTPTTTSGVLMFRTLDIDETEEDIKTTAGNLYGYYYGNTNAAARYLKLYNATAANVVVGTTTPVLTLYLPPTSAGHIGFPYPISFTTAICVACTTGVADSDTGAPSVNDVILNAFYK